MHTGLQKILEQGQLYSDKIIPILLGIAYRLNNLHNTTPDQILHCDVHSANVLHYPTTSGILSCLTLVLLISFGLVIQSMLVTQLMQLQKLCPIKVPILLQWKLFGIEVLVLEMCSRQFPTQQPNQSTLNRVKWGTTDATHVSKIWGCLTIREAYNGGFDKSVKLLNCNSGTVA